MGDCVLIFGVCLKLEILPLKWDLLLGERSFYMNPLIQAIWFGLTLGSTINLVGFQDGTDNKHGGKSG